MTLKDTVESFVSKGLSPAEALIETQNLLDRNFDMRNALSERVELQANETNRARTTQLITLATLLITVTGIFIAQQDIYKELNDRHRFLIVGVLSTLLISVSVGAVSYFMEIRFFGMWSRALKKSGEAIAKGLIEGEFKSMRDLQAKERDILDVLPTTSGENWAWAQFGLLVIGAGGFVLLLVSIMFDFIGF